MTGRFACGITLHGFSIFPTSPRHRPPSVRRWRSISTVTKSSARAGTPARHRRLLDLTTEVPTQNLLRASRSRVLGKEAALRETCGARLTERNRTTAQPGEHDFNGPLDWRWCSIAASSPSIPCSPRPRVKVPLGGAVTLRGRSGTSPWVLPIRW
jgi:hypothetical protein